MDWKLHCRNIKQLDLEEVKKTAEVFKKKSEDIEAKIFQLSNARQSMKNNNILRVHINTWRKEMSYLKKEEKEIESLLKDNCFLWIFKEKAILETESVNLANIEKLQSIISTPLYALRKEIKEWNEIDMKDERLLKQNSVKEAIQNLSDCIQNLNNSLSEESELLSKSQEDGKGRELCKVLYSPIDDLITNEYKKKPFTCNIKDMGIPENAWDWQCSNSEYLSTMLSEFIMLDFEFYNQLEVIKKEYESLRLTE
ncbi:unnamed protein product [Trichobilharzia regenti]|nr:unnamed protein product [Trichobilharzia regenti]